MIKKLFYTILLLAGLRTSAQNLPIGAPSGSVTVQGKLIVDSIFFLPQRTDTMFNPGRPGAMVFAYGQAWLYLGSFWSQLTGIAWGRIPGSITAQHDLDSALNTKQTLVTNGYGWKLVGNAGTFDSANVRKVDTVGRLNDSTLFFAINGHTYNVLLRGTAAGASVLSITLNTPLGLFVSNVNYTSDGVGHWTGTLSLALQSANSFLSGPASGSPGTPGFRVIGVPDLPVNIPNTNLQNSTLGLTMGTSGAAPNFSATTVALGNTIVLNLPTASATITGILSAADWIRFNAATSAIVTSVNGQIGAVITLNADSLGAYPIDFTNFHNGWVLSVDTIHSKLVFSAPGSGSGITQLNGLTPTIQFFANGFTGTSPNWSSIGSTHTLEIPIVNGADTGMVTPALYAAWNAKQPAGNYITALTTDVAAAGPGSVAATIQPNVVTNAKLAQMAANTIKGNNTGSTANASDMTVLQALVLLLGSNSGYLQANGSGALSSSTTVPATAITGVLPVANGGTGTASPGLVNGTNVTITGTWPNQTVNSSGGSGDSGLSPVIFVNLSSVNVPLEKIASGPKRFLYADTISTDPDAMVLQYQLTNAVNAINNTVSNRNDDPAADSLLTWDAFGNTQARQIQDTSAGGSVTVTKSGSSAGVIKYDFALLPTSNNAIDIGSTSAQYYRTVFASNFVSPNTAAIGSTGANPDQFKINGTEKARVSPGGNFLVGSTTDNNAFLQTAANTTTNASLYIAPSAGVAVTSPVNGQLWNDGTHFYLQSGGTSHDLLAGGFSNPMTTNGDIITQAAGVPARLGIGTNGFFPMSNGTSLSYVGLTVGTFSGSSQPNGLNISGNLFTFGPADATNPGMVSTGTQTWAGNKNVVTQSVKDSTTKIANTLYVDRAVAAGGGGGGGGLAAIFGIGQIGIAGTDTVSLTDTAWNRKGVVLSGVGGFNVAEPSVIRDVNSTLLGRPSTDTVFKDYYTEVNSGGYPHVAYAESFTGLPGTFTKYAGSGDSVISGHYRGSVLHITNATFGTVGYYYWGANVAETQIDEYTSSTGAPGSWTLAHSAVITASSLGVTNIYNSWVAIDPSTNTWYMLLDVGLPTTYGFADYLFSSTDGAGAVWTVNASNPVLPKCSGPYFTKLGSTWYIWGHSTMNGADILPTDGYWWSTTNLTNPASYTFLGQAFPRLTTDEGVNTLVGQIGDIDLVPTANNVYMFYTAALNGNSSGGATQKVAVFTGLMNNLVSTAQNAPLRSNWQNNGDGSITYNQDKVLIGGFTGLHFPFVVKENPGTLIHGHLGASVIEAENFLSAGDLTSGANFGYNLYHSNGEGWQSYDSTAAGYTIQASTSGFTYYGRTSGTRLISVPVNLGSWAYNGTNTKITFGSVGALARVYFNGAADDATGNAFQMGGYGMSVANVTMTSQLNGYFFGQGNATSSLNFGIASTKPFAASASGTNNLALQDPLSHCSSCASIVAVGAGAADATTTSSFSTAVGTLALTALTSGNFNSGFGRSALVAVTSGLENSAFGADAGRAFTTHNHNLAVGGESGYTDGTYATSASTDTSSAIGPFAQIGQSSSMEFGGVGPLRDRVGIGQPLPQAFLHISNGLGIAGYSGIRFDLPSITSTALAGTGTIMTFTFASQPYAPFMKGQQITVTGAAPSGYNGTWIVNACSATTLSVTGSATGSQTVAGTIITNGTPPSTELGAIGMSGTHAYYRDQTGLLYDWNAPPALSNGSFTPVTVNATSGYVGLTGIPGAPSSYTMLVQGSDSNMHQVPLGTQGNVQVIGDAAYTVIAGDETVIYSTTLTANRILTIPSPTTNKNRHLRVVTYNINGSGFQLNITDGSANILGNGGSLTPVTTLGVATNVKTLDFISDGTNWYLTQQ